MTINEKAIEPAGGNAWLPVERMIGKGTLKLILHDLSVVEREWNCICWREDMQSFLKGGCVPIAWKPAPKDEWLTLTTREKQLADALLLIKKQAQGSNNVIERNKEIIRIVDQALKLSGVTDEEV